MSRVPDYLLNVYHPLGREQQRATDDVLVRISHRDGRPAVIQYASKGRAKMMLERHRRSRYILGKSDFLVERVAPAEHVS
jgi:hypothetical protein